MGTVVEASGSAMGTAETADEPARVALAAASASALQSREESCNMKPLRAMWRNVRG